MDWPVGGGITVTTVAKSDYADFDEMVRQISDPASGVGTGEGLKSQHTTANTPFTFAGLPAVMWDMRVSVRENEKSLQTVILVDGNNADYVITLVGDESKIDKVRPAAWAVLNTFHEQ